jgi:hypothetical protein
VYAVGHTILTANGRRMASVLAAGPGAVLSHASAAAPWEIRPSAAARVDVSVRTSGGRAKRPGLRIHRARTLRTEEITEHQGIPVTTPTRTLFDLASSLHRRALERALDEAEIRELYDLRALEAIMIGHAGERGAAALQRAIEGAILARAGYRTVRFTHRQLTSRAAEVAATITEVGDSVQNE